MNGEVMCEGPKHCGWAFDGRFRAVERQRNGAGEKEGPVRRPIEERRVHGREMVLTNE